VQGLTEFVPVSSTAHLILAPRFLGIAVPAHPHTYDTVIQAGTLLPVLFFFRAEWLRLIGAALTVARRRSLGDDHYERLLPCLAVGTLPALLAGALLHSRVAELGEPDNPWAFLVIGAALIVVALAMIGAERTMRNGRAESAVTVGDAWRIGIAQAVALIPGVSRSGATITAGMFAGLSREAAARFSFMLMTPVMVAATAFGVLKLLRSPEPVAPDEWRSLLLAMAVAAVVGYFAIAVLLRFLRQNTLYWFVGYRLALGGWLIYLHFAG